MRAIWCHHMKVRVLQTLHLISKYIYFFFNESCSLKLLPKITDSESFFLKALELN